MSRFVLTPTPHGIEDIERTRHKADSLMPGSTAWYDSLKVAGLLKDTTIVGHRDFKVHACYVTAKDPASAQGTAIVVHGYTDNHLVYLYLVRMYRDEFNYNVLFPDLQYHGYSEGDHIQMGWYDRLDIEKWIPVAHDIFQDDFMVLHGVSMGAATVMMTSGARKKYGWGFWEASSVKQLAKCDRPMLFIHGDTDDFVPFEHLQLNYDAKVNGYKEMWVAPGAVHANSYAKYPKEYTQHVRDFLAKVKQMY